MRLKTLRHKTMLSTYGSVDSVDGQLEVLQGSIPYLLPTTATMEAAVKYWSKHGHDQVVKQLEDYEMVEVEVTILQNQT